MARLTFDNYDKTKVRLTQVLRDGERHELLELSVKVLFRGKFAESYTKADNSIVLPTDTKEHDLCGGSPKSDHID